MTRWASVVSGLLAALLLVGYDAAPGPASAANRTMSALVLLPGQLGLPGSTSIATGVRSSLLTEWSLRVSIETEYVDYTRFASSEAEEAHLRAQFGSREWLRPFDVIVAASNEPLDFVRRAREALWPGVPVIVCAVDERLVPNAALPPGFTAVTIRYDFEGTLRAALGLLPDTEHVALVGGAARHEQGLHSLARQAIRTANRRLDVIDLVGLPVTDLLARVAALPERTIVLLSSFQMDGTGQRFYGPEIIEPLARDSSHPVFTVFDHALGHGVVGGSLVDFEAIGREAGALAARVLRGEALPASPIVSIAMSVPRFDARALTRWRLDDGRLPPGSDVLYREPTLWRYRWYLAVAVTLVGAQAALIAALVVERSQRRDAQARLAERLLFEALVTELGAALTVTPPGRLDEQLRDCLRRVVTFLAVDFGGLWRPGGTEGVLEVTHSWSAPGVTAPAAPIDTRHLSYSRSQLETAGGDVSFTRLDDLPPEADVERALFEAAGVRSLAAVTMHAEDRLLGLLAFGTLRRERAWREDVMRQLRILAGYFANPIVRAQDAAAVESSTALTGAVLAALPGETAIIDAAGAIVQTNEAWATVARRAPEDAARALAVGANYLQACREGVAVPSSMGARVESGIASVLRSDRLEFSIEYPTSRYGQDRWFELRVRRVAHLEGGAAVTHLDVTKRRQDEAAARQGLAEIAHLDRVAAMGTLASSIAHELNQPLAAILTNAQAATRLLGSTPTDLGEVEACLADIVTDDRRAAEVLRRMRRLLRKTDVAGGPLALNELIANTIGLVANDALLHSVSIEFAPAAALPVVYGDIVQTQQVILNLLTNAITAAAAGGDPARKVAVWTAPMPAPYVEIGVHDSGAGIRPADLPRVFEPFFTTKPDGLGMGLAISHKIVEAYGGHLMAENDPGGGATFRIHLRTDLPDAARAS